MSSLLSANANNPFGRMHADLLERTPESPEETEKIIAELKDRGNRAFKAKRPEEAVLLYSRAIELDGSNHVLYGNRSAAYHTMCKFEEALADAEAAVENNPGWAKGLFRKGKALSGLKRRHAALDAYREAAAADPSSKMLKKALKKAEEAAAAAPIDNDGNEVTASKSTKKQSKTAAGPPPSSSTRSAPAPSTSGSSSASSADASARGEKVGAEGLMRGYKKTKDGRTTSYFTMEVDEEAKQLIGDIAPKRLDTTGVEKVKSEVEPAVGSAWNKGGTYEERSCQDWAEQLLRSTLSAIKCPGPDVAGAQSVVTVSKIKSLDGDASTILRRGQKRYVFDFDIELSLSVCADDGSEVAQGTASTGDFNSECGESCELAIRFTGGPSRSAAKQWAASGDACSLRVELNQILQRFKSEMRQNF